MSLALNDLSDADVLSAVRQGVQKIRSEVRTLRPVNDSGAGRLLPARPAPLRRLVISPAEPSAAPPAAETDDQKSRRIKRELLDAGITAYGLMKAEAKFLPKLIHQDEHIEAVVYGQHQSSSVMLAATDERIIFVDKKPMALFMDEVSYEVISGLEFEIHTFFATLTLHTPVKNYDIKYANLRCAENFARHIEAHRLRREKPAAPPEAAPPVSAVWPAFFQPRRRELDDMAGYYLLPVDEEQHQVIRPKPHS